MHYGKGGGASRLLCENPLTAVARFKRREIPNLAECRLELLGIVRCHSNPEGVRAWEG